MVEFGVSSVLRFLISVVRLAYSFFKAPFRRFRAQRRALDGQPLPPPALAAGLDATLALLTGPNSDDDLKRRLVAALGRAAIGAGHLRGTAVEQWLRDAGVQEDLQRIARSRLLTRTRGASPHERTLAEYVRLTGDRREFAEDAVSRFVAVMVAGPAANLDEPTSLLLDANAAQTEQLTAEIRGMGSSADLLAATGPLTRLAEDALEQILKRRSVVSSAETRGAIEGLLARLDEGEFRAASEDVKSRALFWALRFSASSDRRTFDRIRARFILLRPKCDLRIPDALLQAELGDVEGALGILRQGRESADTRSVIISILAKAGRKDDVFAWLGDVDVLAAGHLTAMGWRAVASLLMERERWGEAARLLRRLPDQTMEEVPILPYLAGLSLAACALPAAARRALLHETVQVHAGLLETPEAGTSRVAAIGFFGKAEAALREVGPDVAARARVCELSLRLMHPDTRPAAVTEVTAALDGGEPLLGLVPAALAFDVPFAKEEMSRRLARADALGPMTPDELEARLTLLEYEGPGPFLAYLDANEAKLASVMNPEVFAGRRLHAAIELGDLPRARALFDAAGDLLGADTERFADAITRLAGGDTTDRLVERARITGLHIDLLPAFQAQAARGDWTGAVATARRLMADTPTTAHLVNLMKALSESDVSDAKILEEMDRHTGIVARSVELRRIRARALFGVGRLREAREISAALLASPGEEVDAAIYANVALVSGRWRDLKALAKDEWDRREARSPGHLVQVGQLCSTEDPQEALRLVREAVAQAPDDAGILLRASGVALRLADDGEAIPWIHRAAALSTNDGPVRTVDLEETAEFIRSRAETARQVSGLLSSGQLPLHSASAVMGLPVGTTLLTALVRNEREADPRTRTLLPIAPGHRPPLPVSEGIRCPIVDVTSLLILARFEALDLLTTAFEGIRIGWSVLPSLRMDLERVGHQQRSRLKSAERLKELLFDGTLRPLPAGVHVDESFSREVGEELAGLIAHARALGGRVVQPTPIHRPSTGMRDRADLGQAGSLILTTPQFAELLRDRGCIGEETAATALGFLRRQDPEEPPGPPGSTGPVVISWLATSYLESAGLLAALRHSGIVAYVSPNVVQDAAEAAQVQADGEAAQGIIRRLVGYLAEGIDGGKVHVLPRVLPLDDEVDGWNRIAPSFQDILRAGAGDGVLADDRFLLRHATLTHTAGTVPLFGTFDLLAGLEASGRLPMARHRLLRHRLRAAGAAFCPLSAQEILDATATVRSDDSAESPEMRAMREGLTLLRARDVLVLPDESSYLSLLAVAGSAAIRAIWADDAVPIHVARARARWIWVHLVPKGPDWLHRLPEGTRRPGSAALLEDLFQELLPLILRGPRRSAANEWLEKVVIEPLEHDPDVLDAAVRAAKARVAALGRTFERPSHRGPAAEMLIRAMPRTVGHRLLKDPAFLREVGAARLLPYVDLAPGVVVRRPEVVTAVRHVFAKRHPRAVNNLVDGSPVECIPGADGAVFAWTDGTGTRHEQPAPIGFGLLSPHRSVREDALGQLAELAGPGGPDRRGRERAIRASRPSAPSFDALMAEIEDTVPFRMSRVEDDLREGRLRTEALVPSSPSYWSGLCGPAPETPDRDAWVAGPWREHVLRLAGLAPQAAFALLAGANMRAGLLVPEFLVSVEALVDLEEEVVRCWGPFATLSFIEVAARLPRDGRAGDAARRMAEALLAGVLPGEDGAKRLATFAATRNFVERHLAVSPAFSLRPGWWRRLCAGVHAEHLLRAFRNAGARTEELSKYLEGMSAPAAPWAEMIGMGEDPLWRHEMTEVPWTAAEIVGRLFEFLTDDADPIVPADALSEAIRRVGTECGDPMAAFSPGPLELDGIPPERDEVAAANTDLVSQCIGMLERGEHSQAAWGVLDRVSRRHHFGDGVIPALLTFVPKPATGDDEDSDWSILMHAGRIASSQRSAALAEVIIRAATESTGGRAAPFLALQAVAVSSGAWEHRDETLGRLSQACWALANAPGRKAADALLAGISLIRMTLPMDDTWRFSAVEAWVSLRTRMRGDA